MAAVRVATQNDAAAVAEIYTPYVRETAISFEELPPSPDDMSVRITRTLVTHPFRVFEDGDSVLAYAYASAHRERAAYRWSADVAIYAAAQVQRRGVGRALYARLLDILRRQGFHCAFAGVTLPNDNSVGLHKAMGFEHVGTYGEVGFKLGAWRSVGWWQCRIASGPPCGAPIAFGSAGDLSRIAGRTLRWVANLPGFASGVIAETASFPIIVVADVVQGIDFRWRS